MSHPRPPRRDDPPRATMPLRDLALDDHERAFYGSRTGDWLLLGLMVVILLGNGAYIWHQTGAGSHVGRAAFFGLLLLCVLWSALVYTFKLSVCVRVGPQGLSVVRGPWRTELNWREMSRLTERTQMIQGQRYRWLVALARDGRKMQIRDDMVDDYARFRIEVYERYRLWRDHGGTWGTTGGGPYSARETLAGQTFWAAVGAGTLALPAVYFLALLPETDPLGWLLLLLAGLCALASGRGVLRRTTYTVDAKALEARQKTGALRLAWRDVAKVERTRHAFGGAIAASIGLGRFALKLAARTDGRVESFDWAPRVPEYLTLRGGGHQVRVRLHRLERPDELLAWVEFYERVGRRGAESEPVRRTGGPTRRLAPEAVPEQDVWGAGEHTATADLTGANGPADPWGAGRDGEPETYHVSSVLAEQAADEDAWLRAAAPARRQPFLENEPPPLASPVAPGQPDMDTREQSFSGLDIFASRPALDTFPPAPVVAGEYVPPMPPPAFHAVEQAHADAVWEMDPYAATPPPPPPSPPFDAPPFGRQLYTGAEGWQAAEAAPRWQPPYAALPEQEPSAPEARGPADEVEPGAAEDAPTDAIESLADSFAPWRADASWQPPQLPRFGPPAPHRSHEE
ncbi:MAG: hypothetical protein ACRDHP_10270 [Ktedonobacterales bacterium]